MIFKLILLFAYTNLISKICKQSVDINYSGCINSLIHSYATSLFSIFYLLNIPGFTEFYTDLMTISLYYAIYDLFSLWTYNLSNKKALTIHHLMIIISIIMINIKYYDDTDKKILLALNYITEISTPFLNKSTFLYNDKNIHIKEYDLSNKLLVITFFLTRVLGGLYYIFLAYYQPIIIFIAQFTLTSLNYVWFYKIVKMIQKVKQK